MSGVGKLQTVNLSNFEKLPQFAQVPKKLIRDIQVVGSVLPFKANNYVVERLIDWKNIPADPIFQLTFPQKGMLLPEHYAKMAALIDAGAEPAAVKKAANEIRWHLNPHPAGQMEHNLPIIEGEPTLGMQHKYDETILFFPSQGQTCHAYCTFCFRWAQFVGMDDLKFATLEAEKLAAYLGEHPEISDVLFTGGDPMIMRTKHIAAYFDGLLEADPKHLTTLRIGTKALAYWPMRFTEDDDAQELLDVFRRVIDSGRQVSIMAHFNHLVEVQTDEVKAAVQALRAVGVNIRTQSPLVANINDDAAMWAAMWREQTRQGMIPYYMFLARDTGAQHYFKVPLWKAWEIFQGAYKHVSGLSRTVRGPSMSCTPGKVAVDGVVEVAGEKVFQLHFIQGRDPDWVNRPFFAKFDKNAIWLDDLEPAFGAKKFFFEDRLRELFEEEQAAIKRQNAKVEAKKARARSL